MTCTNGSKGFSLIELILVMSLIGILAVVIAPKGAGLLPAIRVQAAAERIASDIRYAQNLSIREGGHAGVVFSSGTNSYSVVRNLTTPVADPAHGGQNLTVSFSSEGRFGGVTLSSALFGSGSTLQFDNLGGPRDGTYAELTGNGVVIVTGGGVTDTVTVSAVTGKVTF